MSPHRGGVEFFWEDLKDRGKNAVPFNNNNHESWQGQSQNNSYASHEGKECLRKYICRRVFIFKKIIAIIILGK